MDEGEEAWNAVDQYFIDKVQKDDKVHKELQVWTFEGAETETLKSQSLSAVRNSPSPAFTISV